MVGRILALMATSTFRNLPEQVIRHLKQTAKARRRSMEAEARQCLTQQFFCPSDLWATVEEVRERASGFLTGKEIDRAIRAARK